jgi:hypothetical protein
MQGEIQVGPALRAYPCRLRLRLFDYLVGSGRASLSGRRHHARNRSCKSCVERQMPVQIAVVERPVEQIHDHVSVAVGRVGRSAMAVVMAAEWVQYLARLQRDMDQAVGTAREATLKPSWR